MHTKLPIHHTITLGFIASRIYQIYTTFHDVLLGSTRDAHRNSEKIFTHHQHTPKQNKTKNFFMPRQQRDNTKDAYRSVENRSVCL